MKSAAYRGWVLDAVAVQPTHVHIVVGVKADPPGTVLLRDFKSYGSRALNASEGTEAPPKWWAERGSTRFLTGEQSRLGAIRYTRDQDAPLVVWLGSADSAGVTGRVFEVEGGKVSVADGWRHGTVIDNGARWEPIEVGNAVQKLLADAPAPTPVYGAG